jgi:maltose alpha-D-glucosyltransferase/alpha-amylase
VILAEANVNKDELVEYFGNGDRLPMLFNFMLNARTFLALARADASPLVHALAEGPTLPPTCQWATFLRNHDEVDLSELTGHERDDTFAAFGPEPAMQLYGRGIRRRLAPMLGNDRARIEMAYALQFALPGTPVIRYGDEIGMGDDLSLPERQAIRTPMQWAPTANGGFSDAGATKLAAPVIDDDTFGFEHVNVESQQRDEESLLGWFRRALRAVRQCPEFGNGSCHYIDTGIRSVLALIHTAPSGTMLALTNLAPEACSIDLGPQPEHQEGRVREVFADRDYTPPDDELKQLELGRFGYRWIRLRENLSRS